MKESRYWDLHAQGLSALGEARIDEAEAAFARAQGEAEAGRLAGLADRACCNRAAIRLERQCFEGVQDDLSRILGQSSDLRARQLAAYYLAISCEQQGRFKSAQYYAGMSSRLAKDLGDRRGRASSLHLLGLLQLTEHHLEAAQECFRKSLEINVKDGIHPHALVTLSVLGYCLGLAGAASEAQALLATVLSGLHEPGCKLYEPGVRLNLGFTCLERDDLDQAVEQAQACLSALAERGPSSDARFAHYLLGEAQAQKGDLEAARESFEHLQRTFYPQHAGLADLLLAVRTSRWINWLGR